MKKFYLTLSLSAAILAAASTAFAGFEMEWMTARQTEEIRGRILDCNNRDETTEERRTILASLNIRDMIRSSAEYLAKRSPEALRLEAQEKEAREAYQVAWSSSLIRFGYREGYFPEEQHQRLMEIREELAEDSFPQHQRLMEIREELQDTIKASVEDLLSGRVEGNAPLSIIQKVLRDKYDQEAARTLADEIASRAGLDDLIRIPRKEEELSEERGIPLAVLRELLAEKQAVAASS